MQRGLFGAKSDDRIDPQRAAGGDDAGEERDEQKENASATKVSGIGRRDAVEQAGEDAGGRERDRDPAATPASERRHTLPQHQSHDVARLRAERDADADLARPLRDQKREHAVETDARRAAARRPRRSRASSVLKRCSASDTAITSVIGRMFVTGMSGSTFQIASFSCLTSSGEESPVVFTTSSLQRFHSWPDCA